MQLRETQRAAVDFAHDKRRCAWWMRPGQGKTLAAITLIKEVLTQDPSLQVLVLAPLRVATKAWVSELKEWAPELSYDLVQGSPAKRAELLAADSPVKIVSHTVIEWLAEQGYTPDVVILDEMSSYKNGSTRRAKAALKLTRQAGHVVGMTGTPAADSYLGLWSQMKIIDGGKALGVYYSHYRDRYFRATATLPTGQPIGWELKEGGDKLIQDAVRPVVFSPEEQTEIRPDVVISPWVETMHLSDASAIKRVSRSGVADLSYNGGPKVKILADSPAAKLNLARQMNAGTVIVPPDAEMDEPREKATIHNTRITALRNCLRRFDNENALISYWYQNDAEDIKKELPNVVDIRESGAIDAWNHGEIKHLLIHPQSAGHGLNLQFGGRVLIWYSLPLSCELWQQTNARLARPGGSLKVAIIPLILDGGPDRQLLQALQGKQKTERELLAELAN